MFWITSERHLFLMAVMLYGGCLINSVVLWRKGFRQHSQVNYILFAAAFVLNTWAMVKRGSSFARCPVNNVYEMLVFVDWTIVAIYLFFGFWPRLRFLGAFASPIVFVTGVLALMPAFDGPYLGKVESANPLASLHAALILLSYGAFGLSSVAAVMYLTQEHDLKFRKLRAVLSLLPPIQRLELVTSRALLAGYILLTLGLAIGGYYYKSTNLGSPAQFYSDPKVLWSIFVWLLYSALLSMRWFFSQGGRRFAWGALGSFAFVLLTFWGFNLLSAIHHSLR